MQEIPDFMFCIQCWIYKTAQMIQNLLWLFGEVSPERNNSSWIWGLLVQWWVETVCVCNNGRLNILSASWMRSLGTRVDTGSEHGRGITSRGNICALLLKLGQSGSWSCWASGAESRCSVCPRWTRMGGWTPASSAEAPMTLGDSFQWKLENKHTHSVVYLAAFELKCYTSYSTFVWSWAAQVTSCQVEGVVGSESREWVCWMVVWTAGRVDGTP